MKSEVSFNEKDVRLHYHLLNHKYLTELRFLKPGMYPAFRIVKDEDKFVSVCRQWNGKRNIYVGLRDRREDLKSCARTEDIIALQAVVLDIDPIRETDTASTTKELNAAITVGKTIKNWFGKNKYKEPIIAVTGNGCCLYFSLPFYQLNDKNRDYTTRKIETFEVWARNNFNKVLKDNRCVMDRMYDLPRIIRVIGTYNIKGKNTQTKPWRLSYWLEKPLERETDKKLLDFISSL
jgi:hypothetical protein